MAEGKVTMTDVCRAAEAIDRFIVQTPMRYSEALGCHLKAESLQRAGAFKIRGALNKLLSLSPEVRARGVIALSSGNHAQGVALAAKLLGNTPAAVVMRPGSLPHKIAATQALGAHVSEGDLYEAQGLAARLHATYVPPFDDPHVIAGQGTVALEILAQASDLDAILVPLGGGGLLAGVALAAHALNPKLKIYGVEPAAGNDGQQSLRRGERVTIENPDTIADGARTPCIGELNFDIIRQHVADILTVPDDALLDAMATLALEDKLVVEPTGALAAAAWMTGACRPPGRVCVVLSGGNVALDVLAQALARRREQATRRP